MHAALNRCEANNNVQGFYLLARKPENYSPVLTTMLKVAAVATIISGCALALAGAGVTESLAVTSGVVPFLVGCTAPAVSHLLGISLASTSNPLTALGCVVTLPTAGLLYFLPFFLPAVVGAAPGLGIAALGVELKHYADKRSRADAAF